MEDLADHELKNWSRWCNLGGTILPWGVSAIVLFDENTAPTPIHEDNAKRVQRIFEVASIIERKVLQAEYLSPSRYARYPGGITAAVDRIKKLEPGLKLNLDVPAYEAALASVKNRVQRAFS